MASEILEKQRFSTASEDSVSSEILEKQPFSTASVACGRCSKTCFEKITCRGENTVPLKDELVQNHAKNCLTSRLKSSEKHVFRQLLLPAAAAVKHLEKITYPGENTVPLKDELV